MRATGIVRRIDELGRVVIPKEIRKTLRIKEGDPLEIYTEREELLLKKYSPIANFDDEAETVASSLGEITDRICLITDGDQVVCCSSSRCKDSVGKHLSEELLKILKDRKSVLSNTQDGGKFIPIFVGDDTQTPCQVIVPVIANGDAIGTVILFGKKDSTPMSAEEVKLASLGAVMLGKLFEQ